MDAEVKWNFQKFAVNENGFLAKVFDSGTDPLSDAVVQWVEQ